MTKYHDIDWYKARLTIEEQTAWTEKKVKLQRLYSDMSDDEACWQAYRLVKNIQAVEGLGIFKSDRF